MNNNNKRQRNLLFYSQKCKDSANLVLLMKNEDLLKYFEMICIDGRENMIPPTITHVPTLIVEGIPKPLIANAAFQWLQNMKYIRYQNMMDANKKTIHYNMMKNIEMGGPKGFTNEFTGFSDEFAYTDIDNSQPKSHYNYKDEVNNAILTLPENDKITKNEQQNIIGKEVAQRKEQEKQFMDYMKSNQLKDVIKSQKEQMMMAKKMGLDS